MELELSQIDYFDSSALVKRYLSEIGSFWVQERCYDANRIIITSEISRVEVTAAFSAKLRGQLITIAEYQQIKMQFKQDCQQQYFLIPVDQICIDEAVELTERQKLRGYDAVHIACALHYNQILLQNNLSSLFFVTADSEQLQAAQAEGLVTENPNQQV